MFMGTLELIAKHVANNNSNFFKKFTSVRSQLEKILVDKKDLLSTIIQRHISNRRTAIHASVLEFLVDKISKGEMPSDAELVAVSKLEGKIVVGTPTTSGIEFSDDTKSKAFINSAIFSAQKCQICEGYLDPTKSISYDHILDRKSGGKGNLENCSLTHPYCNTAVKNGEPLTKATAISTVPSS